MFSLDATQKEKLAVWIKEHDKTCPYAVKQGAIGGRLTWTFTPTSLGLVSRVKCACKEEVDLSDYDSW